MRSQDGIRWEPYKIADASMHDVAYRQGRYVVVGYDGFIRYGEWR